MPARTRTIACPNCGGSIDIRAAGLSISAVCGSCGSVVDVTNPDVRLIGEAQSRLRQPLIALGTRAKLVGTMWEVVGYQVRSDVVEGWSWEEYLLFSPYEGFRFLAADEENWTLYALLPQDVPDPAAGADDGRHYRPMSEGLARTDYVMGEFYWRVRVGDEAMVAEHGDSPYLLSREETNNEVTWSRGLQLTGETVTQAFKLAPKSIAPTAFEKAGARRSDTGNVVLTGIGAVVLLFLLTIVPFGRNHNQLVYTQNFTTTAADRGRPLVSTDFNVPDTGGNLEVAVTAAIRNSWLELGLSLVDTTTQRSLTADITVEEYDGVDSDGSWTEGSRNATALFPRVPGGTYRLLIDTNSLDYGTQPDPRNLDNGRVSFAVVARRHVSSSAFFWLALGLMLIYPVWRILIGFALRGSGQGTRA